VILKRRKSLITVKEWNSWKEN